MANYQEPTPDDIAAWNAWVAARPDAVRKVAERFFPWKLYLLASSGHRVTVLAFSEQVDGKVTMQVAVTGRFNRVAFERRVFGIAPEDLTECDLPAPGEELGSLDLDPRVALARVKAGEIRETDARTAAQPAEGIEVSYATNERGEVVETTSFTAQIVGAQPGYLLTGCFGDVETPEA